MTMAMKIAITIKMVIFIIYRVFICLALDFVFYIIQSIQYPLDREIIYFIL